MDKIIGEKTIAWVELLHKYGATMKTKEGKVEIAPVVRDHIRKIHIALAGKRGSEKYKELETALEDAFKEVEVTSIGSNIPQRLWP